MVVASWKDDPHKVTRLAARLLGLSIVAYGVFVLWGLRIADRHAP